VELDKYEPISYWAHRELRGVVSHRKLLWMIRVGQGNFPDIAPQKVVGENDPTLVRRPS